MSKVEEPLEPKASARKTQTGPQPECADPGEALSDLDEELFAALNFRIASGEIDPEKTTLHRFEAERLEKLRGQEAEDNARAERTRAARGKAAAVQQEFGELQRELKAALAEKADSERVLAAHATELTDLKNRLAARDYELGKLREENLRLKAHLEVSEKRGTALQAALTTEPALPTYENENRPPRTAIESVSEQAARLSRRLAEAESILTAAQNRLRQVEGNVAKVNTERTRIALAHEDERRMLELLDRRTQFETVQERAKDTERVLEEARKFLHPRAEVSRAREALAARPTMKHGVITERLAELDAELSRHLAAPKSVDHSPFSPQRTAVSEQPSRPRAAEASNALSERIGRLEASLLAEKEDAAAAIEEVRAAVRREKMERLATEGALETARRDLADLMRTALTLQDDSAADQSTQQQGAPSRAA